MKEGGIVKSVSTDELRFAMAIFENAALMKTPLANVQARRTIVVDTEDGSVGVYRLADHKLTRGLTAVIDHYKEQNAQDEDRHAIAWRTLCIPDIVKYPACAKWIRETETSLEFEDAVIETLASFPMQYGKEIQMEDFFRHVELAASARAA